MQQVKKVRYLLTKATCNTKNIHGPFPTPENSKMRFSLIAILIIWGTAYLLVRLIINLLIKETDPFSRQALKDLNRNTLGLFVALAILTCFYTMGALDKFGINGEYFINGLGMFLIFWLVSCVSLIYACLYQVKKWRQLESQSKSFEELINEYQSDNNQRSKVFVFKKMEYLLLKTNFILPIFTTFTASCLSKEFNFSLYLEACMLKRLKKFFEFSWTCWLVIITLSFIWAFFASVLTMQSFVK